MIPYSDMVYTIHGTPCMLDTDLAKTYNCPIEDIHMAVENHPELFSGTWFTLTENDRDSLSLPCEAPLPWCFTENGVYSLMLTLDTNLAIKQSIAYIRDFTKIKHLASNQQNLVGQREYLLYAIQQSRDVTKTMSMRTSLANLHQQLYETLLQQSKVLQESELSSLYYAFGNATETRSYILLDNVAVPEDFAYEDLFVTARHSIHIVENNNGVPSLRPIDKSREEIERCLTEEDFYLVINHDTPFEQTFRCKTSRKNQGYRIHAITTVENQSYSF